MNRTFKQLTAEQRFRIYDFRFEYWEWTKQKGWYYWIINCLLLALAKCYHLATARSLLVTNQQRWRSFLLNKIKTWFINRHKFPTLSLYYKLATALGKKLILFLDGFIYLFKKHFPITSNYLLILPNGNGYQTFRRSKTYIFYLFRK